MDKRLVQAVAGSGKTRLIIESLDLENRFLILTYTDGNLKNLKSRIHQKFGCVPSNITVLSYFTFLYSYCYRPFLLVKFPCQGICWEQTPQWTMRLKRDNWQFYATKHRRLYHNRISKLLDVTGTIPLIKDRLGKYFDILMVDEVQDFGGHDFNFLKCMTEAEIGILFVGDFYQHTFDTSRDGNINKSIHDDYVQYLVLFKKMGLSIDESSLITSYRCSPAICDFVSNNLSIPMKAAKARDGDVHIVQDADKASALFKCPKTVKLFYQKSDKYPCFSKNWGKSKGEDCYEDVCVVVNQTTQKHFQKSTLDQLAPSTRNKFYVACTRANGNLYFIPEKLLTTKKSH